MKTKNAITIALLLFSAVAAEAATINFKVTDEDTRPIEAAKVHMSFTRGDPWNPKYKHLKTPGKTDEDGRWMYSAFIIGRRPIGITVLRGGYYKSSILDLRRHMKESKQTGKNNDPIVLVLKKVVEPVPMYARFVNVVLPNVTGTFGYDLVLGDLVAPFGNGENADFVLQARTKNTSRSLALEMTFSKPYDGIQAFLSPGRYSVQSELRSTGLAPKDGFYPSLSQAEMALPEPKGTERLGRINYFFRVRGKNADTPLYGKIYGTFQAVLQGGRDPTVTFIYYLNPDGSNNVEFDPKRNLARNTAREHLPYNP